MGGNLLEGAVFTGSVSCANLSSSPASSWKGEEAFPLANLEAISIASEVSLNKWTLKISELRIASNVEEIFRILKDTTGSGHKVTVLKEDTVAPLHPSGPPSGLTDISVAVMTATG